MLVHRHQWFVFGLALVGIYLAFAESENIRDAGFGGGKLPNSLKGTSLKRVFIKVRSRAHEQVDLIDDILPTFFWYGVAKGRG